MKKYLTFALGCCFAVGSWAQEAEAPKSEGTSSSNTKADATTLNSTEVLLNKKGVAILPAKGSWGLGFNAVPFFSYIGNMFNGNTNNGINIGFVNSNQTIYGKYFWDASTVIRAGFRFGQHNITENNWILRDAATTPDDYVEDIRRTNSSLFHIGVGLEKRRGWGRIQGFYGASVFYSLTRSAEAYTYGNEFSSSNVTPTSTTDFDSGAFDQVNDRIDYRRDDPSHGIGARLFVGVEYFFAPRMSIGGEFGWAAMGVIQSDGIEGRKRFTTVEEEYTKKGNSFQAFSLDTDNFTGAINLMIYF